MPVKTYAKRPCTGQHDSEAERNVIRFAQTHNVFGKPGYVPGSMTAPISATRLIQLHGLYEAALGENRYALAHLIGFAMGSGSDFDKNLDVLGPTFEQEANQMILDGNLPPRRETPDCPRVGDLIYLFNLLPEETDSDLDLKAGFAQALGHISVAMRRQEQQAGVGGSIEDLLASIMSGGLGPRALAAQHGPGPLGLISTQEQLEDLASDDDDDDDYN